MFIRVNLDEWLRFLMSLYIKFIRLNEFFSFAQSGVESHLPVVVPAFPRVAPGKCASPPRLSVALRGLPVTERLIFRFFVGEFL